MKEGQLTNFNIFLLILFVIALAQKNTSIVKNTKEAAPDVKEFVEDYKKLMKGILDEKVVDSVKITMTDLPKPKVGLCWPGQDPKKIQLDIRGWESYDHIKKEVLIFHELGHCTCGLDHNHFTGNYRKETGVPEKKEDRLNSGFLEDGCPTSIMHPILISRECYARHRDHYRYELHLRCYAEVARKKKN